MPLFGFFQSAYTQRQPLAGKANPPDTLVAFEHAVVTDADRTQLQHILAGFSTHKLVDRCHTTTARTARRRS